SGAGLLERVNYGHNFIRLQGLRAERQREKIKETEKLVESKHEILRQKAMDKKIIERFKEKQKKQFEAEQIKNQQKELDEIVSMRMNFVKENEGS
ncbi:MAG: flagellar FliJ family protein, partial [Bdellovibrionales bacterium]